MKPSYLISICTLLLISSYSLFAQDEEKKILIVTGELNRTYEVVDFVFHAKKIEVDVFSFGGYAKAYIEAVTSAIEEIKVAVRKAGADALIDTRFQVVLYPAAKNQNPGDVIITGTVVRFKPDISK